MLATLNLTKSFDGFTALKETSIQIATGEFFSILGPSGCGKTTLLRVLAGFETPDSGTISLNGRDITSTRPEVRPFNLIFQRYALFPHLSVRENISFGPRMSGLSAIEIRNRVAEMLELTRLEDLADRGVATLSGGQQQRVAIARALAKRPQVLLLDEPLSALDQKLRVHMQVELRALQKKLGLTFVLVTHDQDEAFALSDRVAVMNQGVIEQIGIPREIYDTPQSRFVAQFIGSINVLPGGGMVRPERLNLQAASAKGLPLGPSLTGQIEQISFQGAMTQFIFRADSGESLWIAQSSSSHAAGLTTGQRAVVGWSEEDVICVKG